ncbi:MAG: c-type cytochrome [Bacteroidota bacterium]
MKTITILTIFCTLIFCLANCSQQKDAPNDNTAPATADETETAAASLVDRGEYLVGIMGCNDCHTPKIMTKRGPAPDVTRLLSGHRSDEELAPIADQSILQGYALFNMSLTAGVGLWGTTYAANLTPDETGLADWTLERLGKALREGKAKGMDNGRMLLPPMPWQNYQNLSDEDLSAIWAYLQSIPAVSNVVPVPVPPAGAG